MPKNNERPPFENDDAPMINLPSSSGNDFNLDKVDANGIVLYFYPKDDTPGCTKESIAFTEAKDAFKKVGFEIVGVSPDSLKRHEKFIDKHSLGVTLLSDEEKKVCEAYGVWVEKSMYGKKYMGVERSTFLINSDKKILRVWRKVKVAGHVEEVLEAAKSLA